MKTILIVFLLGLMQFNGIQATAGLEVQAIASLDSGSPDLYAVPFRIFNRRHVLFVEKKGNVWNGCTMMLRDLETLIRLDSNDDIELYFGADDKDADHIVMNLAAANGALDFGLKQIQDKALATANPLVFDIKATVTTQKFKIKGGTAINVAANMLNYCSIEIGIRDLDLNRRNNLVL